MEKTYICINKECGYEIRYSSDMKQAVPKKCPKCKGKEFYEK